MLTWVNFGLSRISPMPNSFKLLAVRHMHDTAGDVIDGNLRAAILNRAGNALQRIFRTGEGERLGGGFVLFLGNDRRGLCSACGLK